MNFLPFRICAILAFAFSGFVRLATADSVNRELIVCGWDEVFILDLAQDPPVKVWSWRASDSPELPKTMHAQFRTTDECKPVDGGKRILITSSTDGVALVERATRKALFHATVGNAHSAEMLPGGRIVVAGSTTDKPLGNRLSLFDTKRSAQPLFDTALVSGHGVVWDAKRRLLWALGGEVLRAYRLAHWDTPKPTLEQAAEYALPSEGGHDLMAVPGTNLLSVTTVTKAWLFDRDTHRFSPHPQFANHTNVKSASVHPSTGRIVWTQADEGVWWTATIRLLNPAGVIARPGERLYKARWVASEP